MHLDFVGALKPAQSGSGTPSGIRTRDLHLERVTSWSTRLWGPIAGKTYPVVCGVVNEPAPRLHR